MNGNNNQETGFIDLHDGLFITPALIQLMISFEVLPLRGDDPATYHATATGTLTAGKIRLRVILATGTELELNPTQADNFLTMIGVRRRLVEVPDMKL